MSRKLTGIAGLILLVVLAGLWWAGLFAQVLHWVQGAQRLFQDALGGSLRAIRAGQPGAIWPLLGLCFGYGFLHAVGPGHGKAVLGSYGLTGRAPLGRMLGLALVSSLAQATVAVVLVYAVVLLFEGAREEAEGFAGDVMTPLSWALVAALGLWLIWRGFSGLRRGRGDAVPEGAGHHHHDHSESCGCGHSHGPTPEQAAAVSTGREALALIAAIALRPCSGALLVLVLTWRLGVGPAGIAGAYAMGLGTAAVTAAAAGLSVLARAGVVASLGGIGLPAPVLHGLELAVGAGIVLIAVSSFGLGG